MKQYRDSLKFALAMMPLTVVASLATMQYSLALMEADVKAELLAAVGSIGALIALGLVQTLMILFPTCAVGHHLAKVTGLWRPLRPEKQGVRRGLACGALIGLLLVADYWGCGALIPGLREKTLEGVSWAGLVSGVLYGGIVEELLMRLLVMTLLVWALWKLFAKGEKRPPVWTLVTANLAAALLFALGHLPATQSFFGSITPLLLVRCLLLNGAGGILFGRLYRRYGLTSGMIAHGFSHLVQLALLSLAL